MALTRVQVARRVLLLLAALVFVGIAVASLVAPHQMVKALGYSIEHINTYSEFRAIYTGLWLAHAFILVWAAVRVDLTHLGDVGAVLILGQVFGRLLSLLIDGVPTADLFPIAIVEAVGGVVLLLVRPRRSEKVR